MAGDPRIRGEHESSTSRSRPSPGSSPHTRGALGWFLADEDAIGIIPAYAGSTFRGSGGNVPYADHPRIRGEHPAATRSTGRNSGSSPHTRGAPPSLSQWIAGLRIIPAYAGSTTPTDWRSNARADHPRIRGEHPGRPCRRPRLRGSSPHTRGARNAAENDDVGAGIIPAYAGSTPTSLQCFFDWWDHPRIRGEHCQAILHVSSLARIIPAYAGSTLGNPCNTKDRRRDYTSFPLPVTHPSGGGGS